MTPELAELAHVLAIFAGALAMITALAIASTVGMRAETDQEPR